MLTLIINSPTGILFKGEVELVTVPGASGSFTVLKNHAPIISALTAGMVKYATKEGESTLEIKGGFVEVKSNVVTLCTE